MDVRIKSPCLFSILFFLIILIMIDVLQPALVRSAGSPKIFLEVTDQTLEKTLIQLSKISGYTIELKSRWNDLPVTVHLSNVPLEQAISRILGNQVNHAIIWNDEKKTASIIIYEISQKKRAPVENKAFDDSKNLGEFRGLHKQLFGQGVKFMQASHTADY